MSNTLPMMRILIAAQVAMLEWDNELIGETDSPALDSLDKCLKEALNLVKKMRKE